MQGLKKEGASGRHEAVNGAIKALGGTLEAMYYTFGDRDVICIVEMPDNTAMAALALAVSAGSVRINTTPLLTIQETDKALAARSEYRAPGR